MTAAVEGSVEPRLSGSVEMIGMAALFGAAAGGVIDAWPSQAIGVRGRFILQLPLLGVSLGADWFPSRLVRLRPQATLSLSF